MVIFGYFLRLFIRPTETIEEILRRRISLKRVAVFLLWIGVLRAVFEIVWIFSMSGRFNEITSYMRIPSWYIFETVPFVIANILTAYLRWAMFAALAFFGARVFSKEKRGFGDVLRVYGIALGIYAFGMLLNFVYAFWRLPAVRFEASSVYSPVIGIAQVFGSIFLVVVSYHAVRILFKLSRLEALFIGLLIPLLDRAFLIAATKVFFNAPALINFSAKQVFFISTVCFAVFSVCATAFILYFGFKVGRVKQ